MPIGQRGIRNPICVGACCRHVHFRRCLCHALHRSLVIKSGECVLDSVQMMVFDLLLRVTDAALRQSLLLSLDLIFSLERERQFDQTPYVRVSDGLYKTAHQSTNPFNETP